MQPGSWPRNDLLTGLEETEGQHSVLNQFCSYTHFIIDTLSGYLSNSCLSEGDLKILKELLTE